VKMLVLFLAISAFMLFALCIAKKKQYKKVSAIVLCVALMGTCLTGCSVGGPKLTKHEIAAGETADVNPLKGFFPYETSTDSAFPYSLEWFYLPVNAVHLGEGVFDWSVLESHLNEVASRGHQSVLRFYYDCPGSENGIPQYLLDQGLLVREYNEPDLLVGGGLCPDYSDELFRASMKEFVAEFGKQYDGDPRIAFITEGLLGFWGEWHNWPFDIDLADQKPDWSIPAEVYDEVYKAFDDAFDKTHLLVREPKDDVDNAKYKTGYHDDSFAYATLSFENGGQEWSYMTRMKSHETQDAWEYAPIGGEVYPPLQEYYFMEEYYKTEPAPTDPTADMAIRQNWDACVEESHASFLLCEYIQSGTDTTFENMLDASKSLGYDMQVTTASFADAMETSDALKLNVNIKNNGIAPFYYDHEMWPTLIGIKQNGALVKQYYTTWNMSDIKADGKEVTFKHTVKDHGLGGGEYTINIKVQNPIYNGTIFSFANQGMNEDGWLELGSFTVNGDPAPSYPEVVSDVKPIEFEPPAPMADGENGMYQAENGTVEGIAAPAMVDSAVGKMLVEWVGSGAEGFGNVTFNNVTVEEDGFYNMAVGYISGDPSRKATFDINGGAANGGDTLTYEFLNSGSWTTVGEKNGVVFLKAGSNTVKIYSDENWGPDFDYITVTRGSLNGIQTIDADFADWGETEATYADEFQTVTLNKDDAYVYFAIDAVGGIDNCPDWSVKIATGNSGANYEIKADGLYHIAEEITKVVGAGENNKLHIAQNGNMIEIMVAKDALETETEALGYEIGFAVEYAKDGAVVNTSNGGELITFEVKKNNRRVDVSKRFTGSELRDWSNTNCVYNDELQNIWVTNDDEYLYFAADYDESKVNYSNWSLEFNTDASCYTGYVMDWLWYWEATGNDYKLDASGFYKYTAGSETELISDGSDGSFTYSFTDDGKLEIKLKRSVLELGNRRTVNFGLIFSNEGEKWNKSLVSKKDSKMLIYMMDSNN